ncbi:hypothetical protein Ae201684P_020873 [Aphanomyces euteiches]|nr:hypothetical protein Ae201684P_020873 [Aphanomyces euteiches]
MGSGASSQAEGSNDTFHLFPSLKAEFAGLVADNVADEVVFEKIKEMIAAGVRENEAVLRKRASWSSRNGAERKKSKRHNLFTPGPDVVLSARGGKDDKAHTTTKSPECMKLLRDSIQALLFEATTEDEMDKVVAVMAEMHVDAGNTIIEQNDHGDKFYVLEKGTCEFLVNGIHVGDVGAGGHFGELALIYDAPRAATVRATSDCLLWTLGRNEFRTIQAQASEDSLAKRSHWLRNVPLLSTLSARQLSLLNRALEVVKFEDGDTIVKQGSVGDAFYIIAQGTVVCTMDGSKRHLLLKNTADNEMARLGEGDYFGETSLLNDQPRNCTVRAVGSVKCLRLHRADFDSMLGPLNALLEMNAFKRILCMFDAFKSLSDDDIEHVTTHFDIVEIPSHTVIFEAGSPADYFYIVRSGMVFLEPANPENADEAVVPLNAKDYFGADVFQSATYQSTAVCRDYPSTCFQLSRAFVQDNLASGRRCCGDSDDEQRDVRAVNPLSLLELHDLVHIGDLGEGSFGRVSMVQAFVDAQEYLLALKCVSKSHNCRRIPLSSSFMPLTRHFLYLLMELVQGGELFSVLHTDICERPLVEDDIKFFAANVYLALEHMHKRDIAYRDLKPENLLFSETGYLKLIDMGFAKKIPFAVADEQGNVEVHVRSYTLCGTQEYLAPEFVLNTGHDLAVDYWAFGILVYEMLLGYTPFETPDGDIAKLFKNIAFVRTGANCVQFPHDFTINLPDACNFIECLLNGDPTRRLGMGRHGSQEIRNHPWFHDMDWDKLLREELPPPYVPCLNGRYDTSLFEGDQGLRNVDMDYDGAEDYLFEGF